jgi:peptide/nickel transport system permease protein
VAAATAPAGRTVSERNEHPLLALTARRLGIGVITLFVVSVIVFLATEVLPGNAAFAVLGRSANPVRLHALERQLHLNQSLLAVRAAQRQAGHLARQRPAGVGAS